MVIVGVIVVALFAVHAPAILVCIAGGIAAITWYVRDVRRHKLVRCRICTGSGAHQSQLGGGRWFRRPFGDCWCCGGRKAHPRLAARLLDPKGYQDEKRKIRQGRAEI